MNENHNLNYFQQQVFEEYELIKSLDKTHRLMQKDSEKKRGCLSAPFALLANWFVELILEKERKGKNFAETRREAEDLLGQKEISNKICEAIANITRNEVLVEEKFVKEITAAFYKSELATRFVIPENPFLYAVMARNIYVTGLRNFCAEKK